MKEEKFALNKQFFPFRVPPWIHSVEKADKTEISRVAFPENVQIDLKDRTGSTLFYSGTII